MSTENERPGGWTNEATWALVSELMNVEPDYLFCTREADRLRGEAEALRKLASVIRVAYGPRPGVNYTEVADAFLNP